MTVLPSELDRRFDAVVLLTDPRADLAATRAAATEARDAGVEVAECPDDDRALAALCDDLWRRGIWPADVLVVAPPGAAPALPPTVTGLALDEATTRSVLSDQVLRRRAGELPDVRPAPGWDLEVGAFDPETERVTEALLAVGDGRVGTTGAPVATHPSTRPTVLVAGVYDGDDTSDGLLPAPIALQLPYALPEQPSVRRVLDLRTGLLREDEVTTRGPVSAVRFAALARPGTVVLRARCPDEVVPATLQEPIPDKLRDEGTDDGCAWMRVAAPAGGVAAAVHASSLATEDGGSVQDRVVAYVGDPDAVPPQDGVVSAARAAAGVGFERLLDEQRRTLAARWEDADITVERDEDLQRSTRLALFHLIGSVGDRGEAAVGARGLTGHGYNGHVFWDADTFVLPFFAATHPASARAMLEYRLRRLEPALAAARAEGHAGARFPWESARTGYDVTPTSAFDRAGRLIDVLTGTQEVHIVAEVAWAACCYADWSGDHAFLESDGLPLLVETARYWASRVEVDPDGSAHLRGVIGPDEYHEHVDDDCFTNVMARWNLTRAADTVDQVDTAGARRDETRRWRDLAAALVDGYDAEHHRHEQFRGFSDLEPLVIAEVAPRRPIAADVLMGRERLQGSQVVKQPAVLMLHHLVPGELRPGTLQTDLAYYEPRTAHGSSLSPGVHAALLARAGRLDKALQSLEITAHIDLHDLTGSTASGFHMATAGALWQALVNGFAGMRPSRRRLVVDPHVPASWGELGVRVRFRGSRVELRAGTDDAQVRAEAPVELEVGGTPVEAGPGGLRLRRGADGWEVA